MNPVESHLKFSWSVLVLCLYLFGYLLPYSASQENILTSYDDCGRRDIIEGDSRTEAPWVAAIFSAQKPTDPPKFVITGVILSPTTVLTLFGGAYGSPPRGAKKDYHISNPNINAIVAGIKSTKLENIDEHSQLVHVDYILPYNGHEPENKDFHYFIYHLKIPLNLSTPYVRAACLPEASDFKFDSVETKFIQAGFAYPPKTKGGELSFEVFNVTSQPEAQCSSAFRYYYKGDGPAKHIFCGKASKEVLYRDSCFPHGTPVVFEMGSRWHLGGITALIPGRRRRQCNTNTLYMYSKTFQHYKWMKRNIECGPAKFACGDGSCISIGKVCNGIKNCNDEYDEDQILCDASFRCSDKLTETSCNLNGRCIKKSDICDGKPDCYLGNDEDEARCNRPNPIANKTSLLASSNSKLFPSPKSNMSACYSIPKSEGIVRTCTSNIDKDEIDCENAPIGTWITMSCQMFYISKYRIRSIQMQCKENGLWQPFKPFDCEPNCGILSSDVSPLISHGADTTKKLAFPWHAALFKQNEEGSDYRYICGASLIEKNALFTTGYCVREIRDNPKAAELFKIVLAPVSSNFDDNQNDPFSKIFDIKKVWVPPTFDSRSLNSDIAIVQLTKPVKYGNHIRPVCYLPPGGTTLPDSGEIAKVAGFGKTEKGEFSLTLKYASLPVVNREKCVKDLDLEMMLPNTFCAGNSNETTLCQGDSGNGLVFTDRKGPVGRYTIKGIVSSGNAKQTKECGKSKYSVFTHIDAFNDWIYEILENFPEE